MPHPRIDVVFLPRDLEPEHCRDRTIIVLDVLRATTTMAAALQAGVKKIRIFPSIEEAAQAAREHSGPHILCGEVKCLPPPGFDLGNSPGAFSPALHAGRTMFMSTTNGTRAIRAAMQLRAATQRVAEDPNPRQSPPAIYTGALVNASAVARAVMSPSPGTPREGRGEGSPPPPGNQPPIDITLLCAGTDGIIALEDLLGAGAIIDAMQRLGHAELATDTARIAQRLFHQARHDLPAALQDAQGGRNILSVNLPQDITDAAQLDALDIVGIVTDNPLTVRRM